MGQPQLDDKPVAHAPVSPAQASVSPDAAEAEPVAVAWERPKGLGRKGWITLGAVIALFQVPLLALALRSDQPVTASIPFQDDFSNPDELRRNYWSTGGHWRIINGELLSPGVKNNPLWLQASLPRDVAVEFDVRSESAEGDIKVEIFGDGLNHASGYVLIHGGWNNRLSIVARLDEHGTPLAELQRRASGKDLVGSGLFRDDTRMRVEASPYPVQIGRTYRWRIERKGSQLRWLIDGQQFMSFDDPIPLEGDGHDRFGFSSWESNLYFDNLSIQPL